MSDAASAVAVASDFSWIGPSIQAGAILVSAIGVWLVLRTNRAIARQRAVLDLIIKEETDSAFVLKRKSFVELKTAGNLEQYAPLDKLATEQAVTIRFILNMYEAAAIGIKKRAFDETIYKEWCRATAVRDWMASKEFARAYQRDISPKIYAEFEAMVKQWANDDERKHM